MTGKHGTGGQGHTGHPRKARQLQKNSSDAAPPPSRYRVANNYERNHLMSDLSPSESFWTFHADDPALVVHTGRQVLSRIDEFGANLDTRERLIARALITEALRCLDAADAQSERDAAEDGAL